MSTRRITDTKLTVPPDATFFDFEWSDGEPSTWPTNTTRIVDSDGQVNFMEKIPLDDGRSVRWRLLVADALAAKLGMPKDPKYILRNWPTGYCLFDHHKGKAEDPRHDLYLYGPIRKRFRSINEFVPHAIWLHNNPTLHPDVYCECKYCGGRKSQKEITASISQYLRIGPGSTTSSSPGPGTRYKRERQGHSVSASAPRNNKVTMNRLKGKQRAQPVYASVQRAMKPLDPSPGVLHTPMLAERSNDIRAMHVVDVGPGTVMPLRRWFREGEVVWCALPKPIASISEGVTIDYWPGVVDEVKLRVQAVAKKGHSNKPPPNSVLAEKIPGEGGDGASGSAEATRGFELPTDEDYLDGRGPFLEQTEEDPALWKVRQATEYRVHLLAVQRFHNFVDGEVLPYHAYMPSGHLIQDMFAYPAAKYNLDRESMKVCDPVAGPTIDESISAFAMAIQIAACLANMWCLTDEYDVSLLPPPSSPPSTSLLPPPRAQTPNAPSGSKVPESASRHASPTTPVPTGPLTLQDALDAAARHNAKSTAGLQSTSTASPSTSTQAPEPPTTPEPRPLYREISAINPEASPGDVERATRQILGDLAVPTAKPIQQMRFQGIWWGPERIWVDDFVRLKIPRRSIAPKGGPTIKAPAGPGAVVAAEWEQAGRDMKDLGAGGRGVFMRLSGLVAVETPVEGSETGETIKEVRANGMLYELVDSDWKEDDVDEPNREDSRLEGQGNEKEQPEQEQQQQEKQNGTGRDLNGASVDASIDVDHEQIGSLSIAPADKSNGNAKDASLPLGDAAKLLPNGHDGSLLLPQAPIGYRFRPILKPGYEATICLGLLSGRYYPRILHHPRLKSAVEVALQAPVEVGGVAVASDLWALEGLAAGYHNSVDPVTYKTSRSRMFEDADSSAGAMLEQHIGQRLAAGSEMDTT